MNDKGYHIGPDEVLSDELLDSLYEKLELNDDVYIARNRRGFDFSETSLQLVKHGFEHVVVMKKSEGANLVIHCVKVKKEEPMLSVIVPLYNEESTAQTLLETLFDFEWPMKHEFVIVESNSADRTREIALSYKDRSDVKIVLEDRPSGKGNGVLLGIKEASGQFIAIQDGDLEYDVNDYSKLLPPLRDHETLFMLGSRYNKDDWRMRKFSGQRSWIADYLNLGQRILTWIINTACASKMTDPFTMYKVFHRDCMYGINFVGGNFGLDWELVIRFTRKGYVPKEVSVSYKARSYAEGKHIALIGTPIEGMKALWHSRFATGVYDYGDE